MSLGDQKANPKNPLRIDLDLRIMKPEPCSFRGEPGFIYAFLDTEEKPVEGDVGAFLAHGPHMLRLMTRRHHGENISGQRSIGLRINPHRGRVSHQCHGRSAVALTMSHTADHAVGPRRLAMAPGHHDRTLQSQFTQCPPRAVANRGEFRATPLNSSGDIRLLSGIQHCWNIAPGFHKRDRRRHQRMHYCIAPSDCGRPFSREFFASCDHHAKSSRRVYRHGRPSLAAGCRRSAGGCLPQPWPSAGRGGRKPGRADLQRRPHSRQNPAPGLAPE